MAGAGVQKQLAMRFPARADRLKGVRARVLEAAHGCGCGDGAARDAVLAVDEACQNIIRHAYRGESDGEIVLEIWREGTEMVIQLRDFAQTVAPETIRPRDLDDVRPGGLGTHLMREVMDRVDFLPPPARRGNLLRMVKRIA